ncbi:MAG TPA: FAD-linked oxidase C-terminal domain-containing protein [Beijerinckiaceae bacterium]|nr:FAD-linked oxidase C-terminal domain-containing protein [Beijerinckiaceae bacterium]
MSIGRPSPAVLDLVTAALREAFGVRLSLNETLRRQHAHTLTWGENQPPDAVVYPQTTQEVSAIVRLCAAHRVPVIAFGTGTSLEGHVNAPFGGVCLDMSRMNQIIAVHAEDLDCVVEPGVTRKALNHHLRDSGLFFPIDPGADASIGGMVSTRASGTNAVRYGTMKENVLALQVVGADGAVLRTGTRARKSSAGYDLTRLFVGAEGTLGVVTEIVLRLHGVPEAISAGICPFPNVGAACDATIATIQSGVPVARIELLDALQVKAANLYSKLGLKEEPLLLVEFHGTAASVAEQAERFGEIAGDCGGGPFQWATKPEERAKLWQARHDSYWAAMALRPGSTAVASDVCVPISRLAECVRETQEDILAHRLVAPIVGHVGDGNFHVGMMLDMNDADEVARAERFLERLVRRGLAMEGTCTGEHGVGQTKMKYMLEEHSSEAITAMRRIKQALDPLGVMNPGKILAMQ